MAVRKTDGGKSYPSSAYLVVEDAQSPTTWHLRVRDANGNIDHRLLGASFAALHGGYRGNTYQGPNKGEAISKLRKLYEREGMPVPSEKSFQSSAPRLTTTPGGEGPKGHGREADPRPETSIPQSFTVFKSDDGMSVPSEKSFSVKAQSNEQRAMFAKMGGGGGGGGGKKGGGGSALFPRNEEGERVPTSKYLNKLRDQTASLYKQRTNNDDRIKSLRKQKQTPDRDREIKRLSDENKKLDKQHSATEKKRRNAEADAHNRAPKDNPFANDSEKSFTVFKSDDGSYRWIARSTTAYRDRDGEIITTKALETDAERMTATGQYGPLRYWHIGQPDPFDPQAPWGAGVDIGDCDYSTVIGRTSIESGTFKSADIGAAFAQAADEYELSPGFFHPIDQPTASGEYEEIRRFERSVVPIKYGRASNLFTGMTVKEFAMDQATYDQRVKAYLADMREKGVPPEAAASALAGMEQADKSAQAQGVAYKSDDLWQAVLAALKAAVAPAAPPMDAEDDPAMGGDSGVDEAAEGDQVDDGEDGGEYVGDMSPVAFKEMMGEVLAPVLKMQDMLKAMSDMHGELKGMMGSATKSTNGNAAEIASLKATVADATKRLATLEGDQPAVVSNADVEAALKGAPQAPPDPNAPIVPDDPSRPYAAVAARTFPNLYRQNPDGSFAGWAPQSNS